MFLKLKRTIWKQVENNEKEKEELNLKLENEVKSKEVLTTENNKLRKEINIKDSKIKSIEQKYNDLIRKLSTEEKSKFGVCL